MKDFKHHNRRSIAAVASMALGLAWICFDWQIFYKTEVAGWFNPYYVLTFAAIGVALVLGKEIKERIVLFVISIICSVGMMWSAILILFIDATGRFLENHGSK